MVFNKSTVLLILSFISLILVSLPISWFILSLDNFQKLFSILGSFSLVVAVGTYFYRKTQDEVIAAVDQISFFRKEIIPAYNAFAIKVKGKNSTYSFSRSIIIDSNFNLTAEKYRLELRDQWLLIAKDNDIGDDQISILNMLEEFSVKVLHFNISHHQALSSTRNSFCLIIEQNSMGIFKQRLINGDDMYLATLNLYSLWEKLIDRTSFTARINSELQAVL